MPRVASRPQNLTVSGELVTQPNRDREFYFLVTERFSPEHKSICFGSKNLFYLILQRKDLAELWWSVLSWTINSFVLRVSLNRHSLYAYFHPFSGTWPNVILFLDLFKKPKLRILCWFTRHLRFFGVHGILYMGYFLKSNIKGTFTLMEIVY